MRIKANLKEIENVKNTLNEDSKNISTQIDSLLGQINELKTIWQGSASDEFYNSAEEYISFLKTVPGIYNALSQVMDKAVNNYRSIDKECGLNMKKAVVKHE